MEDDQSQQIHLSEPSAKVRQVAPCLHAQAYFEGRRELFKGLAIEGLEQEWKAYPVLRFDMSLGKHMVMRTAKAVYLFELKINKHSATAIGQMDLKDYASRFAHDGLPVIKVGINFDTQRHTLADWSIIKRFR